MRDGLRRYFRQDAGDARRDQDPGRLCADRHPLCRSVQFDIVSMPRTSKGGNWTVSLHAVAADALWEASDIVADIQEAYDLSVAA